MAVASIEVLGNHFAFRNAGRIDLQGRAKGIMVDFTRKLPDSNAGLIARSVWLPEASHFSEGDFVEPQMDATHPGW